MPIRTSLGTLSCRMEFASSHLVALEMSEFSSHSSQKRWTELVQSFEALSTQMEKQRLPSDSNLRQQDLDIQLVLEAIQRYRQWSETPDRESLVRWFADAKTHDQQNQPTSLSFLWEVSRQPHLPWWNDPTLIRRYADLRTRAEKERLRSFHELLPSAQDVHEKRVDEIRRTIEDTVLCGSKPDRLLPLLDEFEDRLAIWTEHLDTTQKHGHELWRVLSELPWLIRPVEQWTALSAKQATPSSSQQVASLQRDLLDLLGGLQGNADAEIKASSSLFQSDGTSKHAQLRRQIGMLWKDQVDRTEPSTTPSTDLYVELLQSAILPTEVGSLEKAIELRLATWSRLRTVAEATATQDPRNPRTSSVHTLESAAWLWQKQLGASLPIIKSIGQPTSSESPFSNSLDHVLPSGRTSNAWLCRTWPDGQLRLTRDHSRDYGYSVNACSIDRRDCSVPHTASPMTFGMLHSS